jgi:Pvc16 N-terminal domain
MSNFLAIATVTATFSQLLQSAAGVDVPGATVTTLRPDGVGSGTPAPKLNLYLYQVTPNAAFRNVDTPTRRADGTLIQRPQVALDLHYLLSFYGDETQLEPQRLLGSAASIIHARPMLTRSMIRETIASTTFSYLNASNLADDVELVKFSPLALNLEELSKIWSVFFQTTYALSIAYQASVVLIERAELPQTALPVRDRNIYVIPFRHPVIERVSTATGAEQPITIGSTLVITGKQLQNDITQVRIGDTDITPASVSDTQISLPLTSPPLDTNLLRAGIQGIQVIHPLLIGTPPVPHRGIESNIAAFVLRPTITVDIAAVACTTSNNVTRCSAQITVNFTPSVGKNQRVLLLLNEFQPTGKARAYNFPAPSQNGITDPLVDATNTITFPIERVVASTYLVRVQVDGAESLLVVNPDPNNPGYSEPQVTIG